MRRQVHRLHKQGPPALPARTPFGARLGRVQQQAHGLVIDPRFLEAPQRAVGQMEGAERVLDILNMELRLAMVGCGARNVREISKKSLVDPRSRSGSVEETAADSTPAQHTWLELVRDDNTKVVGWESGAGWHRCWSDSYSYFGEAPGLAPSADIGTLLRGQ